MHCGGGRAYKGLLNLLKEEEKDENRHSPEGSSSVCPECGYKISGRFDWCPQCGSRLMPYACEYCQGIIPRDAINCPRCGAPAD